MVNSEPASATVLHFEPIAGRLDVARSQLLLCNISDRPLYYILKCNSTGGITARPSSSGRISAKSSSRIILNWKRPPEVTEWDEVPMPKMLLLTHFVDSHERPTKELTSTRLKAKIVKSASTNPDAEPPTEQLLLDAVTNRDEQQHPQSRSRETCSVEHLLPQVYPAPHHPYPYHAGMQPHAAPPDHASPFTMFILMTVVFLLLLVLFKNSHGVAFVHAPHDANGMK